MDAHPQFKTASEWGTSLGLLPIYLRDTQESQNQYVLMNGSSGNFCLDFGGGIDSLTQQAWAWSCDVGHYVTCAGDSIVVNRWGKGAREQRYSLQSVITHIHDFHRHLEKASSDRSQSIVAHVLRVFRRIRAVDSDGVRSLRVLLHLMACAAGGFGKLSSEKELESWGLTQETIEASRQITPGTWHSLYTDLCGVGRYEVLLPDFGLLLRHASGTVFQEAHLEVGNDSPTLWLPGLEMPVTVEPSAVPTETGIYFTPPALARTLAEEAVRHVNTGAVPNRELIIFDPACGSGELLKECLRLLRVRGYTGRARVIGWDKSISAVDMAKFVLAWEARTWITGTVKIDISQNNSVTSDAWPNNVDILVMNPPFRSWQRLSRTEQEALSKIVGAAGKPNLAMAFAHRAVDAVRESGILAMIAPNSLLEAASGTETRQAMAEALNPILIARLGDQSIFSRALVDAGMYVGSRKPQRRSRTQPSPAAVLWADSHQNSLNRALRGLRKWRDIDSEPLSENGFSVYLRADIGDSGSPWIARPYDSWSLYQRFHDSKKLIPTNAVFDVRQGSRLGHDVFVVPQDYVSGLRKSEQRFFRPAVMNQSISDAHLRSLFYVFFPYGLDESIETEADLKKNVPRYYAERLLPVKDALAGRKTLVRQKELKWWDLLWPRGWQMRLQPKLVSKYFGGPRSFALDSAGVFVVVVGNAWVLKKGVVPSGLFSEDVYMAMLAYMSTSVSYDLLEYLSVQVAGGQLDLSNKYVAGLPIPNLAVMEFSDQKKLIDVGKQICSDNNFEDWEMVDRVVSSILAK